MITNKSKEGKNENYGELLYGIENKRESIEFIVMPLNA